MAQLEALARGATVRGLTSNGTAQVVDVTWHGQNAVTVVFRDEQGRVGDRILYRDAEGDLEVVAAGRAWSLEADGAVLRLASEAQRIQWAHLFDPYVAVTTSLVEPLPHQITAVYEAMLPRLPLRFMLADDPGAGKTIMTGLLIKELVIRGDLKRCLVVCPGALVEQWQDELYGKFGLPFDILTRDLAESARTGNVFQERDLLVARLDQVARGEDLQAQLEQTDWDLIVVDEAHKMSATYFGNEVSYTKRFHLGRKLGELTRHFLLLTATPHNGKEADFQLFLSLLDPDRFAGKYRPGVHKTQADDLMRRMVKEQLVTFAGTPLFPERKAYTVPYQLSDDEARLYEAVTAYVREEFNRADRLAEGKRRGTVGFALTVLQRRLASSPEAIYQSLRRRRERLERNHREAQLHHRVLSLYPDLDDEALEDLEEGLAEDVEGAEEALVDQATAALTVEELRLEIETLTELEALAERVRGSGEDRKWEELARLLRADAMYDEGPGGDGLGARRRRKLIIFTEHRDTLEYLVRRIRTLIGRPEAVVAIHGGVRREERRAVQETFTQDPEVAVLVATDAAGEGINLQRAHLMINYDLPWNPNRLEQRFGRIHRIGQTEVCHCWNLLADETREGDVYRTLLKKLDQERESLQGQVFDVLGKAIPGKELRALLLEAVRYGDQPDVRARLRQKVEGALDHQRLKALLDDEALAHDVLRPEQVYAIRREMERAQARRLQPHYIGSFFREAFVRLGVTMHEREPGRWELTHVPAVVRQRARALGGHGFVPRRYERVCFEKDRVQHEGQPAATLVAPGHPLLAAVLDLVLERHRTALKQGAVLVDEADASATPRALVYLEHAVEDGRTGRDGQALVASRRLQFVEIPLGDDGQPDVGAVRDAGPAPYLDYRPLEEGEQAAVSEFVDRVRGIDLDSGAINFAIEHLVPDHLSTVKGVRLPRLERAKAAVRDRLTKEIMYWDNRAVELKAREEAGKPAARMNSQKARQRADDLQARLGARLEELEREAQLVARPPTVLGGALVVPVGLLRARQGTQKDGVRDHGPKRTERVERVAVETVLETERRLGHHPRDVGALKLGYDVESQEAGEAGRLRFLEIKGRIVGADTVTITRNEILTALNEPERWTLALVEVPPEESEEPPLLRYLSRPPFEEPGFAETARTFRWRELWSLGFDPLAPGASPPASPYSQAHEA